MIEVAIQVENSLAESFRENVKRLMAEQNLSHAALAKRLDCAPNHVTQTLNSNASIRTDTIERWAAELGVDDPLDLLKNFSRVS